MDFLVDVKVIAGEGGVWRRIQGVRSPAVKCNAEGNLLLEPIVEYLLMSGVNLNGSKLYYRSAIISEANGLLTLPGVSLIWVGGSSDGGAGKVAHSDVFVYLGTTPFPSTLSLPLNELTQSPSSYLLTLKHHPAVPFSSTFLHELSLPEISRIHRHPITPPVHDANKREREIGHVIEKVAKWREIQSEWKLQGLHSTLEDAAEEIGIPKKSLDDYLLMIRFGKKLGFNFERHKNDLVGVLRSYVKTQKRIVRELKALHRGERPPGAVLDLMKFENTNPHCQDNACCRLPVCDYSQLLKFLDTLPPTNSSNSS